jgi:formate/nitrite transporter
MLRRSLGSLRLLVPARALAPRGSRTLVSLPTEALAGAVETAGARAARDANTAFTHAALGATFLSCSTCLYLSTMAGTPELRASAPGLHALLGGLIFPTGLAMIVLNGADLLTANFYYFSARGIVEGAPRAAANARAAARVFAVSCAGNAAGSLAMASGAAAVLFPRGSPVAEAARALAERKSRLGAGTAFCKAVVANFLVCTAVYMASASKTPGGKLAALWLPIATFVTLGMEHSVMNYFLIPYGMLVGAEVTVAEALANNLVPVTLGNAVGAFLLARLQLPPAVARAVAERRAKRQ